MGALRVASTTVSGWPPGFGSWARCGALVRCAHLCCEPQRASLALTVWPPSLAAEAPVLILGQRQHQTQSGSRAGCRGKPKRQND
ncbi:hypothetical protein ACIPUP_17630 [Pectobacterium actinidiae]|uniref:Secreted protein n=1 Tax=Pectobacterium actinidiae TaxID=1507808 RepID=A0ABW8GE27_9GAMM